MICFIVFRFDINSIKYVIVSKNLHVFIVLHFAKKLTQPSDIKEDQNRLLQFFKLVKRLNKLAKRTKILMCLTSAQNVCYNKKDIGEEFMAKKTKISKDMTIGEVLKINPDLAEIFMGFGMHCISCAVSQMETVEEAGMVHGIDVDFLLKKLNENVK
jgi:hybrid cluster-associated redox disulfide protein